MSDPVRWKQGGAPGGLDIAPWSDRVRLVEAAQVAGALRFELLSEGRTVATGRSGRKGGKPPFSGRARGPKLPAKGKGGTGRAKPGKRR